MTFIRGPVCRGQMALNVIHDHFWVMFEDPESDLGVINPTFLTLQANNLAMPIEKSSKSLLETFSDAYRERYHRYFLAKQKEYAKFYPHGQGLKSIWKGSKADDAPLLTIYRHFDSASVHKGVLGSIPRTMWVIDYAQLERIYYSLVAGYDVFGNLSHQTNIRRYMDFLRFEGELNFISFLPKKIRLSTLNSWYIGAQTIEKIEKEPIFKIETQITYKTKYHINEFIEQVVKKHILKSTHIQFDTFNYIKKGATPPKMPVSFLTEQDLQNAAKNLTLPGTGFIRHVTGDDVNVLLVRIKMPYNRDIVISIVVNRWHDNVNSLFGESKRLNPSLDTLDL